MKFNICLIFAMKLLKTGMTNKPNLKRIEKIGIYNIENIYSLSLASR
jgi:hypothetical protein